MNEHDEVMGLFPTPVFMSNIGRDFTKEELDVAINCKLRSNTGNLSSESGTELDNPILKNIKLFIESKIERVYRDIVSPKSDSEIYITQSWFNHTSKGQYHHQHSHANSFLSGVLYFDANPATDRIYFSKFGIPKQIDVGTAVYNEFNSDSWFFPVETGKIVIFPSTLSHRVETIIEDDHTRISLAFNTFIRGYLGNYDNKTGLQLL
jgi:uncharacterized protein (TIGR02466 family)